LRASARPVPFDLLQIAVSISVLTFVWRIQNIYPILARVQLPVVAAVSAMGLFAFGMDPRRRWTNLRHPVVTLVMVILGLMFLSLTGGFLPSMALTFIVGDHIKTVVFFALIVLSVRTFADVERYGAVLMFGGMLYSLIAIRRFHLGSGGDELYFYDLNDFAMMAVCTLPIAIYFTWRRGHLMRIAGAVSSGLFLYVIVKSGSRGGFLGLLAAMMGLLIGFKAVSWRVRASLVAALVVGVSFAGNAAYWERIRTILHPEDDYNWTGKTDTGRMEVWKRGMGYMVSSPFGVGARNFPRAEGTLSPQAELQAFGHGWKWSFAHNSFVQIGAELGVLGLLSFLLLLGAAFRALRAVTQRSRDGPGEEVERPAAMAQALVATLAGYCVAGFFLSQAYAAMLYALLGIVVGLSNVSLGTGGRRQQTARVQRRPMGVPGSAGRHRPPRPADRRLPAI